MPHRAGIAALLLALALAAQDDSGPMLFRPLDKTVLPAGPLSIVARAGAGARLLLDGRPLPVKRPAPGVMTATIAAAKGKHELRPLFDGGESIAEFFVGPGAPAGWRDFHAHPPAGDCESCHAVADGKWAVKGESTGENCFACHERKKFPAAHQHAPEVLKQCEMRHPSAWLGGESAPEILQGDGLRIMPRVSARRACATLDRRL